METNTLPAFLLFADKAQFNTARFCPYSTILYRNPSRGEILLDGYICKAYNYFHGAFSLWHSAMELPPPKELI